jgi:hypothetical protein
MSDSFDLMSLICSSPQSKEIWGILDDDQRMQVLEELERKIDDEFPKEEEGEHPGDRMERLAYMTGTPRPLTVHTVAKSVLTTPAGGASTGRPTAQPRLPSARPTGSAVRWSSSRW